MYVSFSQGDYAEAVFTNQIDYYIKKVVGVFLSNIKRRRLRFLFLRIQDCRRNFVGRVSQKFKSISSVRALHSSLASENPIDFCDVTHFRVLST